MHSRTFRSQSDVLIERARRQGSSREAELFAELTDRHEHAMCFRPALRPTERIRTSHSSKLIQGISIRPGRKHADVITVDSLTDDLPLLPALDGDAEIISGQDEAAGLPSDPEIRALLTDLVHAFMQEDIRSVSARIRMSLRRTLVIAEGRCMHSIRPAATLRMDIELGDRSTGTVVGNVLDNRQLLDPNRGFEFARQAVDQAQHRSQSSRPSSGAMPVLLLDRSSGMWVHETIGHMLEADAFSAGPFAETMGSEIAPAFVNVVDDPAGIGSDDEGTPAHRTMLIRNGILTGALTDRVSADRYGLPRTGNGRRQDYRCMPQPRQWGARMLPGEASSADLLAGVSSGIAVVHARRAGVLPNGSFSLGDATGFLIEHGRLSKPVAGFSVEGDAWQSLHNIELVGSEVATAVPASCVKHDQAVDVHIESPGIRFRRLAVRAH